MFVAVIAIGLIAPLSHQPVTSVPPAVAPPVPGSPTPEAGTIAGKTLAIGGPPVPGGRSAGLVVTTSPDRITIHSGSPMPVIVSLSNGYGAPLRPWATLARGQAQGQTLVTGRSYGYCFEQAAGHGYGGTRGCGTLVMHRFVNGVQVPDGATVAMNTTFPGP
jgi:hypothetical protein